MSADLPTNVFWPDRRLIGMLQLADEAHRSDTNPASWFLDPTVDVISPAGIAAFHTRLLNNIDLDIAILKRLNAQGGIFWSLDGGRYETYLGSPDIAIQINPELDGAVDECFSRFRAANLRPGVCIRPDEFNFDTHKLEASLSPYGTLLRKARYARKRWGCRLFYVDSNMWDCRTSMELLPPLMFASLRKACPGCLFITEHEKPPGMTFDDARTFWNALSYWAEAPQYIEFFRGEVRTPSIIRQMMPGAFSAINVNNTDLAANQEMLKAAVAGGDILLANTWFESPDLVQLASIYASI